MPRFCSRGEDDITDSDQMKKLDPDMRALFEMLSINEQSQVDKETLDFIYDFIEQHGGVKAVKDGAQKGEPKTKSRIRLPPPPNRGTAPPPRRPRRSQAVPPPPPSGLRRVMLPPPPPSNRYQPPPPPPSRKPFVLPPPPPTNRNQSQPAQPDKKWTGPPLPPPPTRQTGVPPLPTRTRETGVPPPPPPAKTQAGPPQPPPPGFNKNPPGGKQAGLPQPPPASASADTSSKDFVGGAAGGDNPLKQQIMQLLLHNPAEITDFIYDIVDKRGGLGFIKDNFAERNSGTDPSKQNAQESERGFTDNRDDVKDPSDDQVPGRSSIDDQVPGRSSSEDQVPGRSFTADEVPGRTSTDNVSGATAQRLSDIELISDVFDDDDDEWNELADQIDQY